MAIFFWASGEGLGDNLNCILLASSLLPPQGDWDEERIGEEGRGDDNVVILLYWLVSLAESLQRRETNQRSPSLSSLLSSLQCSSPDCSAPAQTAAITKYAYNVTTTTITALPLRFTISSTPQNTVQRREKEEACRARDGMFGFQRSQQQFRCTSSLMRSLLVCGVVLGVLWNVVHCELVSVCEEEDGDLRVDCHVEPRANQINSYEFSMSTGTVETVVNTNVSGSSPDVRYRDHSYVEQLEPYGYRLTLNADTHTHTLTNTHTTFICKISKNIASIIIEKNDLLPCSADRVLVQSCCWLLGVLLSLWGLPPQ